MIKADMHIHSTVSDGSFTIPELISLSLIHISEPTRP